MVSYFVSFLTTGTIIYFANDFFKTVYPNTYENVCINVSLQLIYTYSAFQMTFRNIHNYFIDFVLCNPLIGNMVDFICKKSNCIEKINKNGEIIEKNIIYENINPDYNDANNDTNNELFYIFTDNEKSIPSIPNKIIKQSSHFKTDLPSRTQNYETIITKIMQIFLFYEESSVKFILFEIDIDSRKHLIYFKTDKYNYYIVGNIFDKKFLKYYLKNHLDVLDVDKYEYFNVKMLDQNVVVKEFQISDDKFITINKNDYSY
jgi:hypothetical protein